jgi:hypothetical protein
MRAQITAVLVVLLLAAAASLGSPAGAAEGLEGSCLASRSLPCSAMDGQTYGGVTLGTDTPAGNDAEPAVEAVLRYVVDPAVDVVQLGWELTWDSPDIDLTPDPVTQSQAFDWVFHGSAANLAYISVKASTGFAVFGVAGLTSGHVDVAALLGGHDISHIRLWLATRSVGDPITPTKLHGQGLFGNTHLAKIDKALVPCVHAETGEVAQCRFGPRSGIWLEADCGDYAMTGQAITRDGKPGGDWAIAARVSASGKVLSVKPSGRDSAGTVYDTDLAGSCMLETALSAANATGNPLVNYATLEVCTSSNPHPDGAQLTRVLDGASSATSARVPRSTTATAPSATTPASTWRGRSIAM